MSKFWYFSAMVIFIDRTLYYSGYVTSKEGLFPIDTAETQTKCYVSVPDGYDKVQNFKQVIILNQVEVQGGRYDVWKEKMKF